MAIEYTLSIIKPDIVAKGLVSIILSKIIASGLKIVTIKMVHLTKNQVAEFYKEHKDQLFFSDLINFISSGPIVASVLKGENAINHYRNLIGTTNPLYALPGTIRYEFATDLTKNAIHGSDSIVSATREILFFFKNFFKEKDVNL